MDKDIGPSIRTVRMCKCKLIYIYIRIRNERYEFEMNFNLIRRKCDNFILFYRSILCLTVSADIDMYFIK